MAGVACPLCSSTSCQVKWRGEQAWNPSSEGAFHCTTTVRRRPEVWRCGDCSHLFTNPNSWPKRLSEEYEVLEDHEYLRMLPAKYRTFRRAANLLSQFAPPPAEILEVGCYAGAFLDEARSRGYQATGIEPSLWGIKHCLELGHSVIQGTAEDAIESLAPRRFAAVISWDVLEHVRSPTRFMSRLASVTEPGGVVLISTLDRTNWFARLLGRRWPWVIPMHFHYFDQETVRGISESCDLVLLQTGAHVHYSTPGYALSRLLGIPHYRRPNSLTRSRSRWVFPVGFGDVRYYVFRKKSDTDQ